MTDARLKILFLKRISLCVLQIWDCQQVAPEAVWGAGELALMLVSLEHVHAGRETRRFGTGHLPYCVQVALGRMRKKRDGWFLRHGREIYRICLLQLR